MKYRDKDGDVWVDLGSGRLECVESSTPYYTGMVLGRGDVEDEHGPLVPVSESAEPDLPTVESVMSRGDTFRAAHALIDGLKWDEKASVYDVLQVAKWLEGDA